MLYHRAWIITLQCLCVQCFGSAALAAPVWHLCSLLLSEPVRAAPLLLSSAVRWPLNRRCCRRVSWMTWSSTLLQIHYLYCIMFIIFMLSTYYALAWTINVHHIHTIEDSLYSSWLWPWWKNNRNTTWSPGCDPQGLCSYP